MQNIQIFSNPEFGEVRTVTIEGEPWFVGRDVAQALGYVKPEGAIRNNVDRDDTLTEGIGVRTGTRADGTPSIQNMQMLIINESGLYSLIFGSKLESAKKFKKWVTSEVLPTIRKTGSYGRQLPQSPMELLELHYEAIRHVDNKVDALAEELTQFKQELPLFGIDEDKIVTAVHRKGVECLGGKGSNAYKDKSTHDKVFRDIYREVKRQFGISGTYKQLKRNQCDMAVNIVKEYQLPMYLVEQIADCNAQLNMEEISTKEKEQTQ